MQRARFGEGVRGSVPPNSATLRPSYALSKRVVSDSELLFQIRHRAPDSIGQVIPRRLTGWLAGFIDQTFPQIGPDNYRLNKLPEKSYRRMRWRPRQPWAGGEPLLQSARGFGAFLLQSARGFMRNRSYKVHVDNYRFSLACTQISPDKLHVVCPCKGEKLYVGQFMSPSAFSPRNHVAAPAASCDIESCLSR